jgi:hypothetical protein
VDHNGVLTVSDSTSHEMGVEPWLSLQTFKAPSGLEPLFSENADPERQALEHSAPAVPELNPFLARVLERVKQNEAERAR